MRVNTGVQASHAARVGIGVIIREGIKVQSKNLQRDASSSWASGLCLSMAVSIPNYKS